jgi:hypothetical protein
MATAVQPLLVLSPERIHGELDRAATLAAYAAQDHRRTVRLVLLGVSDYLVGLVAIGWSFHLSSADVGLILFYAGLLRALGWPAWRLILSRWLEENGW